MTRHEPTGALADGMQYLVLRDKRGANQGMHDGGRAIRGLASYGSSSVASMLSDVLRLCDLDLHGPAAQDSLPAVSFALDLLYAASRNKAFHSAPPTPAMVGMPGLFVDGATAELLDRLISMLQAPEGAARDALATEFVAWGDMRDRSDADRDKALAFALLGARAGHPSRPEWGGRLMHHRVFGPWVSAMRAQGEGE